MHTAPGHGQDDYVVGSRYGLPVDNPVGNDGRFLPGTELFAGEHVFAANDKVIEVLKARGTLVHEEMLRHSYPHCWRHKTPIIFRATPQWFISMEQQGLREAAMAARGARYRKRDVRSAMRYGLLGGYPSSAASPRSIVRSIFSGLRACRLWDTSAGRMIISPVASLGPRSPE